MSQSIVINDFSAGEVEVAFHDKYDSNSKSGYHQMGAARYIENFLSPISGKYLISRPGTRLIGKSKYGDANARIFDFKIGESLGLSFHVELGDQYVRYIQAQNGLADYVKQNNQIKENPTPYLPKDLWDVDYAVAGRTAYLVHKNYKIRQITRLDLNPQDFTFSELEFAKRDNTTISNPQMVSYPFWGGIVLESLYRSAQNIEFLFSSTDGKVYTNKPYQFSQCIYRISKTETIITSDSNNLTTQTIAYIKILTVSPSTINNHYEATYKVVGGDINSIEPVAGSNPVTYKLKPSLLDNNIIEWMVEAGFDGTEQPSAICSAARNTIMLAAGTTVMRSRLNVANDFGFYSDSFLANSPSFGDLAFESQGNIYALVPSTNAEYAITQDAGYALITNKNGASSNTIGAQRRFTDGAAKIKPIMIGSYILYVESNKIKISANVYNDDAGRSNKIQLDYTNTIILSEGIKQIAYQRTPYPQLWILLETGDLVLCSLKISGDSLIFLGFTRFKTQGKYISISCVATNTGVDSVVALVLRKINGIDTRLIEQFDFKASYIQQATSGVHMDGVFEITNPSTIDRPDGKYMLGFDIYAGQEGMDVIFIYNNGERLVNDIREKRNIGIDGSIKLNSNDLAIVNNYNNVTVQIGFSFDKVYSPIPLRPQAGINLSISNIWLKTDYSVFPDVYIRTGESDAEKRLVTGARRLEAKEIFDGNEREENYSIPQISCEPRTTINNYFTIKSNLPQMCKINRITYQIG